MKFRTGNRGFTLVELFIVVCIVGVLAGILLTRVIFYQELAERAAMQQVVSAVRTALVLEYGHRMTLNLGREIYKISDENPMDWLAQKPANYVGEFKTIKPDTIEPGNWAFDMGAHELVYIPDHNNYFSAAKDGFKWVRFRLRYVYTTYTGNKDRGIKEPTGVTFVPVETYQWQIRDN